MFKLFFRSQHWLKCHILMLNITCWPHKNPTLD